MNTKLNTEFSLGKIVDLLARDGVKSEIMHTGGGNATLYIGEPNDKDFYPVVCGAGVYDYENPANSIGFSDQFWIGRDDDENQGQGFYYTGANDLKRIENVIFNYFMNGLENTDTCELCNANPVANNESDICANCAPNEALTDGAN